IAREMSADAEIRHVPAGAIPDGWKGLDIGPETAGTYADEIDPAKTVLWNGPMGVFELAPFAAGARRVPQAGAQCRGQTPVRGAPDGSRVRHRSRIDRWWRLARTDRARRSARSRSVTRKELS